MGWNAPCLRDALSPAAHRPSSRTSKNKVIKEAQEKAKKTTGATKQKIEKLQAERKSLLNDKNTSPPGVIPVTTMATTTLSLPHTPDCDSTPDNLTEEGETQCSNCEAKRSRSINELIDHQNERKHLETRVKGLTELNHIMKYAVNLSKEKRPRDTPDFLR
jgi:hypothetical protein